MSHEVNDAEQARRVSQFSSHHHYQYVLEMIPGQEDEGGGELMIPIQCISCETTGSCDCAGISTLFEPPWLFCLTHGDFLCDLFLKCLFSELCDVTHFVSHQGKKCRCGSLAYLHTSTGGSVSLLGK